MDIGRLVAMANDIAAFFDSEPDKAVAAEGVRFHLTRFWDPRMRREIVAHVQGGGAGLSHDREVRGCSAELIAQINQSEARGAPCEWCAVSVLRPMIESLAARLAARKFVVTGELTPPKGTDLTKLFATAELLRGCVDAINVTESPRARMAMDPRAVAFCCSSGASRRSFRSPAAIAIASRSSRTC